ncbi:MAG: putative membrane protein YfcA [Rhodothermales bacterium]|jgi:uncharacterized membrane protein YfcA
MNLILIGLVTGVLTGLTGASGMSVLISALLLIGMDVHDVVGLTFTVTLANALGAMGPYIRRNQWDKRLVLAVGLPAVAGVFVGNAAGHSVPSQGLTAVMSVALLAVGLRFLLQKKKAEGSAPFPAVRGGLPALIAMGMLIGVVMGIMGGGGSIFITLALVLAFRYPLRVALGSSIMIMAIAAVPGILLNLQQAHLDLSHAAQLVIPGGIAALLASRVANRIAELTVYRILGVYLVVVSIVLLVRL